MTVKVEILYAPTCASYLVWLDRIRRAIDDLGGGVVVEEVDVLENPEIMRRYRPHIWPEFREGYIHYFLLVAVNGKVVDWYWDVDKVVEAVREELEAEV